MGSAAVGMGYSLNTVDETELDAVADMLIALKPKLYAISSDVQPPLRDRGLVATIAWTGNGVQVVRDNPDTAQYIVASDGGELWVDSWGIAADAPHKDAAYAFLDYILQPENSARGHRVLRCSRTPTRRPGAAAAGGQRQPGHLPARGAARRR